MIPFHTVFFFVLMFLSVAPLHGEERVPDEIRRQSEVLYQTHRNAGPRFSLIGEVEPGKNAPYSINGQDFSLHDDALIVGGIGMGKVARVRGIIQDGSFVALKVFVGDGRRTRSASVDDEDRKSSPGEAPSVTAFD